MGNAASPTKVHLRFHEASSWSLAGELLGGAAVLTVEPERDVFDALPDRLKCLGCAEELVRVGPLHGHPGHRVLGCKRTDCREAVHAASVLLTQLVLQDRIHSRPRTCEAVRVAMSNLCSDMAARSDRLKPSGEVAHG